MIRSAVTPLIENITGIVRSYSPIEGMPELRDVLREHNQQAIEFINRSLDVHLQLLRQQLHVESAVLLWLRPKDGTLEIRACDSMRDAFVYGSYAISEGILDAALCDPLRFDEPIEAHKIIPYYDQSITLGGLLSTPVYLSSRERADGILLVDRSSTDPWDRHAHSTLKIIAEKISLDFETSQLLRQVTYDAGQVERLCYCLRKLNEAFGLDEVERCMVESIGVYDGFESASYFALQESGELRLKSRWIHPQIIDTLGRTDQLIAVGNLLEPGHYLLSRAAREESDFSTLFDPAPPADYLPTQDWTLNCAAGVMVRPLRDPHSDRVCGVLLLTVSSEEVIQPRKLTAFRLLIEQVEVKLSLVNAHERLKVMASIDWLTGLKNHMTFQSESGEMLKRAQRDQSALAFVLLDIDHFKSVNDNYGHPFGDLVLKRVAETLCQEVRDVDLVARYGGEEFAFVLHATELDQALVSIDRVRRKVEEIRFDFEDQLVQVTISLGVACYPIDSRQQERLIDKADKALYQSKRNGRNQATAWRSIEPEERDSSVSWTRAPTHYIEESSQVSGPDQSPLDTHNQTFSKALSFDLEELTPPTYSNSSRRKP
jgi:diguanylate cyclase (GGDEF)-like protein